MADQKFTKKDVEKFNKAFADSNDEVKNLYDQLMDVFDVSGKITKQYNSISKEIEKSNSELNVSKELVMDYQRKISENNEILKNNNDIIKKHSIITTRINDLESEKLSLLQESESIGRKILKNGGLLQRIDKDMLLNMQSRAELTNKAEENAKKQLDIASRLQDVEFDIREGGEGDVHTAESYKRLVKERAELQKKSHTLSIEQLFLNKKFTQSEAAYGDLINERNRTQERGEQLLMQEVLATERLKNVEEDLTKEIKKRNAIESKHDINAIKKQSNELVKENIKLESGIVDEQEHQFQIINKISKLTSQLNFWKLIQLGYERFVALDKAAEDFRKQTGFSNTQMVELRKNAESINLEFQDMGVGINEVYTSAKALTDVFGRTSLVSKEAMQNVSLMSANLGVAAEDSANVLATFQGLGGASQEVAMNVMKVGASLSEKAGVPFSLVMKDIANASEQTTAMLGANPSKLMKSAIAARALGTDMNKIVSSQRKLLDFSSSINDELELSALLGKSVSFQKARQLAYDGDIAGAARATLETVKAAGDFESMSVYQREALAKASGMELKDLTKMMAVDKQREEIELRGTDEQKAQLKMQTEALAKLEKENDLSKEGLLAEGKRAIRQQKMQGQMTKLKNIMDSLTVSLGDILEPVITGLSDVVVPLFKVLAGILKITIIPLMKLMAFPIEMIGKGLGWIVAKTEAWANSAKPIADIVKSISSALDTPIGQVGKFIAGGGLLYMLFAGKMGFGAVTKGISSSFGMLKGGLSKIPGLGRLGGGGGAIGKVGDIAKSAKGGGFGESLGKGIASFMKYVAKGIGYFGSGSVLKGALGIALVSASIIPFAFAMKMFSGIDWESVGIGSLALLGFTAAAFGLGALLSTEVGAAIFGAGVIGIAALGLALIPFAAAASMAGAGIKMLGEGIASSVDSILRLSQIDLTKTALGIGAVGIALAAFGGGSAAAGLGSFVGGLLGGDPIKKMERLGAVGEKLKITAESISAISNVMSTFTVVDSFAKSIDTLSNSLSNLNDQVEKISVLKLAAITAIGAVGAATSAAPAAAGATTTMNTSGIEAKLDTLTNLLTGGAVRVYLDGKDVSAAMTGIGR